MTDIVVTGLGALAPGGVGVEALWQAALAGTLPERRVERFDASDLPAARCAPLPSEALRGIPSSLSFRYDRHAQLAWVAAREAFDDAGLDRVDRSRMGVVVGTAHGPVAWVERELEALEPPWVDAISAYASPRLSLNTATSAVALTLGLEGPQTGIATACAAGLSALQVAFDHLAAGRADAMLAGGSDAAITKLTFSAYNKIGAMSVGGYRPFDVTRDGFVMGEGAAFVALERRDHAAARGARILARLVGTGAACDGEHQTRMSEDGRGYRSAMSQALRDAVRPVDLVNAHGSGTPVNDRVEGAALRATFGRECPRVQSTKALTGHMMGAAGAVEAVLSVLQIHHQVELPTAGCREVDEACAVPVRLGEPRERPLHHVLCNAAGFGGPIASALFGAP